MFCRRKSEEREHCTHDNEEGRLPQHNLKLPFEAWTQLGSDLSHTLRLPLKYIKQLNVSYQENNHFNLTPLILPRRATRNCARNLLTPEAPGKGAASRESLCFFKSGALHVKYVYPVFISAKIKALI